MKHLYKYYIMCCNLIYSSTKTKFPQTLLYTCFLFIYLEIFFKKHFNPVIQLNVLCQNVSSLESNFYKIFFVSGPIYNSELLKVLMRIDGYPTLITRTLE